MEAAVSAMFFAVQLYDPSIVFLVFGNCSSNPPSIFFTTAAVGSFSPSKLQDTFGFGKPVALQLMLAVVPSGTVWFLGDTST